VRRESAVFVLVEIMKCLDSIPESASTRASYAIRRTSFSFSIVCSGSASLTSTASSNAISSSRFNEPNFLRGAKLSR